MNNHCAKVVLWASRVVSRRAQPSKVLRVSRLGMARAKPDSVRTLLAVWARMHRLHAMICRIDRQVAILAALAGAILLAGCGQNGVEVYEVAKEPASPAAPASAPSAGDPHAGMRAGIPQVKWAQLPAGWTQVAQAGGMRAATIKLPAPEGQQAELAIIPMAGMAGKEPQLVNMWRQQVSLEPLPASELAQATEIVRVGNTEGKLFEMAGKVPSGENSFDGRILVAITHQGGYDWFFKMAGHDQPVAAQKAALVEFLKGISWEAAPAGAGGAMAGALPSGHPPIGAAGAAAEPAADASPSIWDVPEGWRRLSGGQFLFAKFQASGDGGATADINVSTSAGTGGGLLPNVNRWRGQLGLAPVDEAGLQDMTEAIETPAGTVKVVAMAGTNARTGKKASLVAAVAMLPDSAWFYKLMGDEAVVAAQKEAFLDFVRSARYSQ